jgi:hypothetical protein
MLWIDQNEPLDEKTLKMQFVECGNEYVFILYPFPFRNDKLNLGFYRSISSSESYNIFKRNFTGKAFFTFGTIGDGIKPSIFNKARVDIKFMKKEDAKKDSIEGIAETYQWSRRHRKNE